MKKLKSLTIFFPAYNDEKMIGKLVVDAYMFGQKVTNDLEVIVIDDGSTDKTSHVLKMQKSKYPKLKLAVHKKNRGYGAALRSGIKNSTKNWVFYTDGDGQYDVRELKKLVEKVKVGIDVVNGYKMKRSDNFLRISLGKICNFLLHVLYDPPVSDVDCDFRLMRRSKLEGIRFKTNSGIFPLELVLKLKNNEARFTEVPVSHKRRVYGSSQFFRPRQLFLTCIEHIQFFYYTKFRFSVQ